MLLCRPLLQKGHCCFVPVSAHVQLAATHTTKSSCSKLQEAYKLPTACQRLASRQCSLQCTKSVRMSTKSKKYIFMVGASSCVIWPQPRSSCLALLNQLLVCVPGNNGQPASADFELMCCNFEGSCTAIDGLPMSETRGALKLCAADCWPICPGCPPSPTLAWPRGGTLSRRMMEVCSFIRTLLSEIEDPSTQFTQHHKQ